jgi:hypothetical protein
MRVVVIAPGDGRPDVAAPIDYPSGFLRHGMQAEDGNVRVLEGLGVRGSPSFERPEPQTALDYKPFR